MKLEIVTEKIRIYAPLKLKENFIFDSMGGFEQKASCLPGRHFTT
jgi:hypothetical protein